MQKKNSKIRSLIHSGVEGMHWGERRYQNYDGSLTPLGRLHYGIKSGSVRVTQSKNRGLFNKNALFDPKGFEILSKQYGEKHKDDRVDRLGDPKRSFDEMTEQAYNLWMYNKPGSYNKLHTSIMNQVNEIINVSNKWNHDYYRDHSDSIETARAVVAQNPNWLRTRLSDMKEAGEGWAALLAVEKSLI